MVHMIRALISLKTFTNTLKEWTQGQIFLSYEFFKISRNVQSKRNDALLHRLDAIDCKSGVILDREIESIDVNEHCERLSDLTLLWCASKSITFISLGNSLSKKTVFISMQLDVGVSTMELVWTSRMFKPSSTKYRSLFGVLWDSSKNEKHQSTQLTQQVSYL
jgi:hypothetical protein